MNQLILENKELNRKYIEISTLKSQNEKLKNELRSKKDFIERMNKTSEVVKYFEDLMRSPRGMNDTTRLGYNSTTKKGESSKSGEQRNEKGKHTCYYSGKLGHTTNVCRSKNVNQGPKQNAKGQCHKCKKQGHQTHECRSKSSNTQNFNGYCYNFHKFGHRENECRSKPNQTLIGKENHLSKETLMIGITTQGIVVIIVKNMDTFLRIA